MSLLKIKNLSKAYGTGKAKTQAIQNLNLEINKGDFVAIMGASGSGKSTLLNLISTIDKPSGGEIIIDKIDISKLSNAKANDFRKNHLGFIFQDFRLLDSLTVEDNISVPLIIQKKKKSEMENKLVELMNILSITDLKGKYPYQISGGEKQRTACARAVIAEPDLILADEPTGALDSKNAQNIMGIMSQINNRYNTTILMVTHDPMSASYSKRVIFLRDGCITNSIEKRGEVISDFYNRIVEHNSEMQQSVK